MIAAYVYYEGSVLDAKCFDDTTDAHHFANEYWDCTRGQVVYIRDLETGRVIAFLSPDLDASEWIRYDAVGRIVKIGEAE